VLAMNRGARIPNEIHIEDGISFRRLWTAVLVQALIDVGALTAPTAIRKTETRNKFISLRPEYREAKHWLLHNDTHFALVCTMAGLDGRYMRERMRKVLGV
jgi:hypothetical protein